MVFERLGKSSSRSSGSGQLVGVLAIPATMVVALVNMGGGGACDADWEGPCSINASTNDWQCKVDGVSHVGTDGTNGQSGGNRLHSWMNNAWGDGSDADNTSDISKCHPGLPGVAVCQVDPVTGVISSNCAYTQGAMSTSGSRTAPAGEYWFNNAPTGNVYLSQRIDGYVGLLLPWDSFEAPSLSHPALEMPSCELQHDGFSAIGEAGDICGGKAGASVFVVSTGATCLDADGNALGYGDCLAPNNYQTDIQDVSCNQSTGFVDHHEVNGKASNIWARYRRIDPVTLAPLTEWFGNNDILGCEDGGTADDDENPDGAAEACAIQNDWPAAWTTNVGSFDDFNTVYLDANESPSTGADRTTTAGLAIVLPGYGTWSGAGFYEFEAANINTDELCRPVEGEPHRSEPGMQHRVLTWLIGGHLSDVRFVCN